MQNKEPLSLLVYDLISNKLLWLDILLVVKVITTVLVLMVFRYHEIISSIREFRTSYPNLYKSLDREYYNNNKWYFILMPGMDFYFVYLLFKNRYTTIAFLKKFAVKKEYSIWGRKP